MQGGCLLHRRHACGSSSRQAGERKRVGSHPDSLCLQCLLASHREQSPCPSKHAVAARRCGAPCMTLSAAAGGPGRPGRGPRRAGPALLRPAKGAAAAPSKELGAGAGSGGNTKVGGGAAAPATPWTLPLPPPSSIPPQNGCAELTGLYLRQGLGARAQAAFDAGLLHRAPQLDPAVAFEMDYMFKVVNLGWELVQVASQRGSLSAGGWVGGWGREGRGGGGGASLQGPGCRGEWAADWCR